MVAHTGQLLRREEVLAYIVEQLVRTGACPPVRRIGHALKLSEARIRQLVDQLVALGQLERLPGGGFVVLDVTAAREIALAALRRLGFRDETVIEGCAHPQLPILGQIEHLPGITWPELDP